MMCVTTVVLKDVLFDSIHRNEDFPIVFLHKTQAEHE
jgi:hypothetical protein